MKDLLYLKDDQIKELIQLLYYAHRETFADPRDILSKKLFGPAHLRALHLIERNPIKIKSNKYLNLKDFLIVLFLG